MNDLNHYKLLAEMFRYPSANLNNHVEKWRELISKYDPGLSLYLENFISFINEKPLANQQEYFIKTFDVQAMCFLDIGYVLFGEDYKRGVFMVNIKKEQIKVGNDCGSELPDHLPNILTLLPKIQDRVLAEELIYSIMIPALNEMILKFRGSENMYKGLLQILVKIMEMDYPDSDFERYKFNVQKKSSTIECPVVANSRSNER